MFINALLENLSGILMEELTSVYIPAGGRGSCIIFCFAACAVNVAHKLMLIVKVKIFLFIYLIASHPITNNKMNSK